MCNFQSWSYISNNYVIWLLYFYFTVPSLFRVFFVHNYFIDSSIAQRFIKCWEGPLTAHIVSPELLVLHIVTFSFMLFKQCISNIWLSTHFKVNAKLNDCLNHSFSLFDDIFCSKSLEDLWRWWVQDRKKIWNFISIKLN